MLADREEKFNIFTALHKAHDERRLHSRFISVLLQPKGSHGFNSDFLELFIKNINVSSSIMETDSNLDKDSEESEAAQKKQLVKFKITPDTIVFPAENDKKENNNIDILIIDRVNKQAIIVENKIYAGDSEGAGGKQLERYISHVVDEIENIPIDNVAVIYLTLDGHNPSDDSVGKYYGKKDIILCSYEHSIIPWLEDCLTLTARAPFLRESILQYIKLIKKMTTDSSTEEERKAYRNLIGESNENMQAAYKLHQNFKHIKWHAVWDFWNDMQQRVREQYSITKKVIEDDGRSNVITDLTHFEDYRVGQKNKQKCYLNFIITDGLEITIRFTPLGGFYFGVSNQINLTSSAQLKIEKLLENNLKYQKTKYLFIHKLFNTQIIFNDFNQELTFDLINPNKNTSMVNEAWNEVCAFIEEYNKA